MDTKILLLAAASLLKKDTLNSLPLSEMSRHWKLVPRAEIFRDLLYLMFLVTDMTLPDSSEKRGERGKEKKRNKGKGL